MRDGRTARFSKGFLSLRASCVLAMLLLPQAALSQTCDRPVAEAVSVQGTVQALRAGNTDDPGHWQPVRLKDLFCPGDTIRVRESGRADLLLANETLLRIDRHTTVKILAPDPAGGQVLDLIVGAFYFITRTPRKLNVNTPFVNAGVEGTEFLIRVERDRTLLTVFEGTVLAANPAGMLRVAGGQSAVAEAGKAPVLRIVARPRDAVQWTLYYPPVFPPPRPGAEAGWDARASSLLAVGNVEEARTVIEEALKTDPRNASAYALLTTIAVARNEKDESLALARKAVEADPRAAPARIALSYALQARFDLAGARESLRDAVNAEPGNALAWARLAEMEMSFGDLDEALKAARQAAGLAPDVARTQVVLGFAFLAQVKTKEAQEAFERAIVLDQADPLARLGLGLARIREGDLTGGRKEIEIAASLDPQNSLIRSYLGKAYHDEKRDALARGQFGMAKEFDPSDPTPYFYDALRKQTVNRPVEALRDLRKSIELNDNRAVYRSRLLLDDDLAVRSASLGRIYGDLGFPQLALVEGWKSVNADPANHSAHRFLADSYSALPRQEIARVSELLQAQLLQPLNVNPLQPRLAHTNLAILSGAGPGTVSSNEFNPLFQRDRVAMQASGVIGENDTSGEEIILSGVQGIFSYSVGQFRFDTDGFRPNNDLTQDIRDLFAQVSLSHKSSIQAEFRSRETENGDLALRFNPDDFLPNFRNEERSRSLRVGFHHGFSPGSDLIGSAIFRRISGDAHDVFPPILFDARNEENSHGAELQHLFRAERLSLIVGAGHFRAERRRVFDVTLDLPPPIGPIVLPPDVRDTGIDHANLYFYSHIIRPKKLTLTLGGSVDFFRGAGRDTDQFNPKLGVTWYPFPGTVLRAAVLRVFKGGLTTNPTLEPTQVAGLSQFFDDDEGTKSWRYGVAADQRLTDNLYAGAEYSQRDLDRPFDVGGPPPAVLRADWKERLGRAYLYWTPHPWFALRGEYQYDRFDRARESIPEFDRVTTQRVPLGIGFFHPCGGSAGLNATFVDQDGNFRRQGSAADAFSQGSDRFVVVDASAGYRLPRRYGILSLEAKNLFDRTFSFQDTDPFNPVMQPKRSVFFKLTLAL